jgi:TonB family protein
MRKTFSIMIVVLTFSIVSFSQDTLKFYYKPNGKETDNITKAEYSTLVFKDNEKTKMRKVFLESGNVIQETELKSWIPFIEDGLTTYYDNNTKAIKAKGYYKNGILDCTWLYKKDNSIFDTVNYSSLQPYIIYPEKQKKFKFPPYDSVYYFMVECMPQVGFYPDLMEKRSDYDKLVNQLIKGGQYQTNREAYNNILVRINDNNRIAFDRYKNANVQYPIRAKENGKKGTVIAQFVVNELGIVSDIGILKSVDRDLDMETVRLIRNLPISSVGMHKGEPVKVIMSCGVEFK